MISDLSVAVWTAPSLLVINGFRSCAATELPSIRLLVDMEEDEGLN